MTKNQAKRPRLEDILPRGQLVDRSWLYKHGFKRPDIDYHLRANNLQAPFRGVYQRPGLQLKWQNVIFSLNEMGYKTHLGGEAALNQLGYAHNITLSEIQIELYSAESLPAWLDQWQTRFESNFSIKCYKQAWLAELPEGLVKTIPYGQWDWPVHYAQPELAILEYLFSLKTEADFLHTNKLFESLATLSPNRLQLALEHCNSIKVRRLLGWYASHHKHAWFNHLDWEKINTGKGKRSLFKGGKLDSQWKITLPNSLAGKSKGNNGSEQPLF